MTSATNYRKAYMIGGGIGSLAAAAFLVRDCNFVGSNITIFDAAATMGGALDAGGDPRKGYSMRGGRMLTTDNYECTWALFKTIPSLADPAQTVYEETIAFNEKFKSHSRARLIDKNRAIVDVTSMGFTMKDRIELVRIAEASEEKLGASRITDWLSPEFFDTNFWYMWSTTFAFQPWHSAVEFKRYLHRFMKEFPRIETLAGVKRTIFNQYDSLVRPLQVWLEQQGVRFLADTVVSDLQLANADGSTRVVSLVYTEKSRTNSVALSVNDLVFFQNASMTDASSVGAMTMAAQSLTKADSGGWSLWERLAESRPEFGKPAVFNSSISESYWQSFTVTLKGTIFFDRMEALSGNKAGTGELVTFKDSRWMMSIVLPHQPHFANQPADVQVFWGYALHPDRIGDFVAKPMSQCAGEEILRELAGHLNFDFLEAFSNTICIPCRLPYVTSMFMPRAAADRPVPVPKGCKNLAFISQFVEIPEDVVFTVEYSVRVAQTAVYELLGVDKEIPPISPHDKSLRVNIDSVVKAFL